MGILSCSYSYGGSRQPKPSPSARRQASITATPASTERNARRSVTWIWHPPQGRPACFWNVGSNVTGRKWTPARPSAFRAPASASASMPGAPTSSNGRVVPRPSDSSVPSSSTVPG